MTSLRSITLCLLLVTGSSAQNADFNGDRVIDFDDFFLFADSFGTSRGDSRFSSQYDLNNDTTIDLDDFFIFGDLFGTTAEPEFFLGEVQIPDDLYNSIPLATIPLTGILPSAVDLSGLFPAVGDQGRQGSCVGWAIAYLKSYQEVVEHGWSLGVLEHIFSPAYIYKSDSCRGLCWRFSNPWRAQSAARKGMRYSANNGLRRSRL